MKSYCLQLLKRERAHCASWLFSSAKAAVGRRYLQSLNYAQFFSSCTSYWKLTFIYSIMKSMSFSEASCTCVGRKPHIKDNNGLLANFTSCYHLHITISSNPGRGKKRSVKR